MDKIVSLCRRRGFVFPSSEIYGGLGSTYDYGHYGVLTKNNIRELWFKAMVQEREDIVAIDSAIILHPRVWEASGHVSGFTDPLVDCRTCKLRFREDQLGVSACGRKPSKHPGEFSECDLTEARQFNLMFTTHVGALEDAARWHEYWIKERYDWHVKYGLRESQLRIREHDASERSHYSSATSDIEYLYPIGWSELEGIANRGAYDLTQHTNASGAKLEYVGADGERYTPHVIEPAVSIERIFVAMLVDAYDEEVIAERERTVLRLHPAIAPVKAAILPLIGKNDDMVTRARSLYDELRRRHVVEYDDGGAIGRRYRRQDEIGTPFAFTLDKQALEDDWRSPKAD